MEEILNKDLDTQRIPSDETVYRKNLEWLNSVKENKLKFEEKLKNEYKITDETVLIISVIF